MADYRDIINGTINSIISKVKDVAENGTVREVYDAGLSRAKTYGRVAKLTLEMNGETEELKRVYAEIGRLYYDQAKDAPEGFFAPLFDKVESLCASISSKEEEVRSVRDSFGPDIAVEFGDYDDVVSRDEDK